MTVATVQRQLEMEMPSAKDSSGDLKAMIEAWLPAVEIPVLNLCYTQA